MVATPRSTKYFQMRMKRYLRQRWPSLRRNAKRHSLHSKKRSRRTSRRRRLSSRRSKRWLRLLMKQTRTSQYWRPYNRNGKRSKWFLQRRQTSYGATINSMLSSSTTCWIWIAKHVNTISRRILRRKRSCVKQQRSWQKRRMSSVLSISYKNFIKSIARRDQLQKNFANRFGHALKQQALLSTSVTNSTLKLSAIAKRRTLQRRLLYARRLKRWSNKRIKLHPIGRNIQKRLLLFNRNGRRSALLHKRWT